MQTFNRRHSFALKNKGISHGFHSQHPDLVRNQARENLMLKTSKMRVHYIQRHLHGVEAEFVSSSDLQHPEMNERIFMARKTDVTDLPCLPGVHHGFDRAAGCKDSIWVF